MTPEKLKDFLITPTLCPYCSDLNVKVVTVDQTPDTLTQHYFCLKCDKVWFGKFKLTLIETGEL